MHGQTKVFLPLPTASGRCAMDSLTFRPVLVVCGEGQALWRHFGNGPLSRLYACFGFHVHRLRGASLEMLMEEFNC